MKKSYMFKEHNNKLTTVPYHFMQCNNYVVHQHTIAIVTVLIRLVYVRAGLDCGTGLPSGSIVERVQKLATVDTFLALNPDTSSTCNDSGQARDWETPMR